MAKAILPEDADWKIDPAIDVNRVSMEDVKLIFAQAEKKLDDSAKTVESFASKTMSMITLMAGILIALMSYLISNWKDMSSMTSKEYVASVGCLYILVLFIYVINNVLPTKYFALGSEPQSLFLPSFFAAGIPQEKITVFLYMSEIENYNKRIVRNLTVAERSLRRYRHAVLCFLAFPFFLGVLFSLLEWIF
jgi:hypothetical protein